MTRRDVESFAGAHDAARAAFHLDLDLARQGDALMVVLAGRSTGDRLDVLGPAPTRLVHHAGDVDLAENHHLHRHQRLPDELVRLVERPAHDGHRARIRRAPCQLWVAAMSGDDQDRGDVGDLDGGLITGRAGSL